MQTKKNSLFESVVNTLTGFLVSLLIQFIIYPALKIPVSLNQNIFITVIFTGASIVRGYFIRRLFNLIKNKKK